MLAFKQSLKLQLGSVLDVIGVLIDMILMHVDTATVVAAVLFVLVVVYVLMMTSAVIVVCVKLVANAHVLPLVVEILLPARIVLTAQIIVIVMMMSEKKTLTLQFTESLGL